VTNGHASLLNMDIGTDRAAGSRWPHSAVISISVLPGHATVNYPIEDGDVHIILDQQDSTAKALTITSPVLDRIRSRAGSTSTTSPVSSASGEQYAQAVKENFRIDRLHVPVRCGYGALAALRSDLEQDTQSVDCRYRWHVKDLHLATVNPSV